MGFLRKDVEEMTDYKLIMSGRILRNLTLIVDKIRRRRTEKTAVNWTHSWHGLPLTIRIYELVGRRV